MRFFKKSTTSPFDYRTLYKYLPDRYRLKVGLALGSGGARGLTHLGVIKALMSSGVKIEYVSGASVGALVGAFLAAGKLDELIEFVAPLTRKESLKLVDIMFPTSGLIEGKKIEQMLRERLGTLKIEDLPIPFACVATNFYTGQEVILTKGDLVTAVRASISIPGVFKPVTVGDMLLLDGGVVNPVPVQVVRDLGAEFIIAVDICPEIEKKIAVKRTAVDQKEPGLRAPGGDAQKLPSVFEIIMGSIGIMESQLVDIRMKAERPDILIKPQVEDIGTYDFHRYQEVFGRGGSAVEQIISKVARYVGMIKHSKETSVGTRRPDSTLT
jgi:NTE family protein